METKTELLDNLNLRSEQVQDVLERPPHWLIRWGSLLLLSLLGLFFLLACLISYPEFIPAPIIISSKYPAERIEARIDSRIQKIYVKDQQQVKKGQLLMALESTADYQDILKLKNLLDSLNGRNIMSFPLREGSALVLGEVQEDYNAFAKALEDEKLYDQLQPYSAEGLSSSKNIRDYEGRIVNMKQQLEIEDAKMLLIEKNYQRAEALQKQGVISMQDLENERMKLLEAQKNIKNSQLAIAQLEEAITNFRKQKTGVDVNSIRDKTSFSSSKDLLLEKLKKAIRQWERLYLMYASIDGTVSFLQFLGENQFVKPGTVLLSILPADKNNLIGQMHLGSQNLGKIAINQKVQIKLDNYRYQEFGMLTGYVESISLMQDKDQKYYIEVALPENLKTSYNKELKFDKELSGTAEIVTEDLTLAERILHQIRSLIR